VSTIAFGTDEGVVNISGLPQRVPVDRDALAQLAKTTGGYYAEAASSDELKKVYQDMGSSIGHRSQPQDLTYVAIGLALLCGVATVGFALLWSPRLP
jgi:Ca-activated chloride channel family protein